MSLPQAFVPRDPVKTYTKLAFVYDAWTWFTESKSLRAVVAGATIRDGEAVLEVAVGTGFVFREILQSNPGGRNVGVDLTEAMLRRAREKAKQTGVPFELSLADARALPYADQTFDLVISNNMFGLLADKDIARVVQEMFRVLRPGGRAVMATMVKPTFWFSRWVYQIGAVSLGGWHDVDLEPIVSAAGFDRLRRTEVAQIGITTQIVHASKPLRTA